ncbi:MAG: ribonuclease R family protein [Thermosynechococcaceae cyanobacterium]
MELSISSLLKSFPDDKLVAPKALEKKLNCEEETNLQHLQIALDALVRIGLLTKERGRYRRVSEDDLVEGKLRCSSKGFCFAIQDLEETEDIYIRESQLNNAWNGDRVLVKITKEGRRRRSPEGEVRVILERANPSVIARVKALEEDQYRAVPLDDRLLFELELDAKKHDISLQEAAEQLVHVEVVQYPLGPLNPKGKITQVLGSDAQSAADTELVFCKYDLPRTFPDVVLQAVEELPVKLRKADQKKRVTLQKVPTVTIGDATAQPTSLDHALSLEVLEGGNWQLGIHVVDLAYYLSMDTTITQEALHRGHTMCLGEKVLALYSEEVLNRIGALLPKTERLSISVLVTLNSDGEVVEFEVQPTVIKVDHQLSYRDAQLVLNRKESKAEKPPKSLSAAHELIDQLAQVSQALLKQRQQEGGFVLPLFDPPPRVCGDDDALGVVVATPDDARAMMAEFLVLANRLVTNHLQALGVPAVYRVQAPPDVQDIQDVIKLANNVGLPLTLQEEEAVQPQDYQTFIKAFEGAEQAPILYDLLRGALKPATHSDVAGPHFGQAQAQGYGHFASPLNRYSDLLNQYVLSAIFAEGRDRRTTRAKEKVNLRHSSCHGNIGWNVLPPERQRELETAIATAIPQLNEAEQLCRQAEGDLLGLQKTKQMQGHTGQVLQGIITGIQSYGFFVRIEDLMVEGLVHVSSLKDDWYEYRSRQQTLIGRKNRRQYQLGDRVEVEVKSVDYYRQQVDLLVVGGGSEASEEDLETEPVIIKKGSSGEEE